MRRNKNISKKEKTAPGTLIHVGKEYDKQSLTLIEYDSDYFNESKLDNLNDFINSSSHNFWLNIDGLSNIELIKKAGEIFNLHPLILEDILNTTERTKIDFYEDKIFIITKLLSVNDTKFEILDEQISLILTPNGVITFREKKGNTFENVLERLKRGTSIRKNGPSYLLYALLDSIADSYFDTLEKIDEKIDLIEEELMTNPKEDLLKKIYEIKREMVYLRNAVWPLRNVINTLIISDMDFIDDKTKIYMRDVYDHIVQIIDIIETYRDIISGMLDTYLSSISNKINEVMKFLTIFSTIFIPLTFLAGIYGMNFQNIPELTWQYGYLFFWVLSSIILLFLIRFFKRKKWL